MKMAPTVSPNSQLRLFGARGSSADHATTVSKILGGSAARLAAGAKSGPVQETASSVYHVIEGSGQSRIGDSTFLWKKGDTFCIPSWYSYEHFADEGEAPVYLYRLDDRPMLKSLGFYRTSTMDVRSLVSA